MLRDTEIAKLDLALPVDENVCWLDVLKRISISSPVTVASHTPMHNILDKRVSLVTTAGGKSTHQIIFQRLEAPNNTCTYPREHRFG